MEGKEIQPPPRASGSSSQSQANTVSAPPRSERDGSSAADLAIHIGLALHSGKSPTGHDGDGGGSGRKQRMPQQPHSTHGYPGGDFASAGAPQRGGGGGGGGAVGNFRLTKEAISTLIEGPEQTVGMRSAPNSYGTLSGQSSAHTSVSEGMSRLTRGSSGVPSRERSYEEGGPAQYRGSSSHASHNAGQSAGAIEQDADLDRLRQSLPVELRQYGAPSEYQSSPFGGGGGGSSRGGAPTSTPPPMERGMSAPSMLKTPGGGGGQNTSTPLSRQGLMMAALGQPSSGAFSSPRSSQGSREAWDEVEEGGRKGLTDAVMRKLKVKNAKLDEELRQKKLQMEEIVRNVTSWKKSIKDRHADKMHQLEQALKSKVNQERERGHGHKVRVVKAVAKRYRMLTKMACFQHWYQRVHMSSSRRRMSDAQGRTAASERMVEFLKEQLSRTGDASRKAADSPEAEEANLELERVNLLLVGLLAQIPSGVVVEFEEENILSMVRETYGSPEGSAASKMGMLWSEVRELVSRTSGKDQPVGGAAEVAGISNELAIARLRGKVDHITGILKSRDAQIVTLTEQLEASGSSRDKLEQVSKECALANVRAKELELLVEQTRAETAEKESQAKQLTARVASLTASLHDKEEEAALLAGLQRNIADIKEVANLVLPPAPGGGADDESFAALKRIGAALESLRVKCVDLEAKNADASKRLAESQTELRESLGKAAQLVAVSQRAAELEKEVADLNEGAREHEVQMQKAVLELDNARNENATLQTQAQQMLRDAERVSALARERAHALEEKGNVIDRLQKANREMETSQLASSDELAAGRIDVAKAREEASRLSQEAQAAARQAAEAEAKAKAVESELALAKQEVLRLDGLAKAGSAALREKDAAEVRAEIEGHNLEQVKGEMQAAAAELAKARERAEELERRVAQLEGDLANARRHAAQVGGGGIGAGDATTGGGGAVAGESGQTPSPKAVAGGGAMEREIIECLRKEVAWAEEECDLLRKMIRNKKGGEEGGGAGRGKEGGGLGKEGRGEEGGGLTVDEWRTVVAHGRDANGFGQFGIKRPLFSAVRSAFFKA